MLRLDVYTGSTVQDCDAILAQALAAGITDVATLRQVLRDAVEERLHHARQAAEQAVTAQSVSHPGPRCSACGGPATVTAVNVSRCTRMAEPYKSAIVCQNPRGCGQVDYSFESAAKVRRGAK